MVVPVTEVITSALRLCGQMGAPGRAYSTDQATEILQRLNKMIDSWNVFRANIFQIRIEEFVLVPAQVTYTLGPSGDFNTTRPAGILRANIILVGSTPRVRVPLEILEVDQWASVPVPALSVSLPIKLYIDNDYPLRKLYFWGYSDTANRVELFMTKQLPATLIISDSISLPDGYQDAIEYSLAERIAPLYWQKTNALLAEVKDEARKARGRLQSANSVSFRYQNDATRVVKTGQPQPYFNYLTGGLR